MNFSHLRQGIGAVVLASALVAGVVGAAHAPRGSASEQSFGLRYLRGYSLQHVAWQTWLCYGWANGSYHCTQHWYRDGAGHLRSANPGWVPNGATSALPAVASVSPVPPSSAARSLALRTTISAWNGTGYAAYPAPWGAVKGYAAGNCTAGAAALSADIPSGLGNAANWSAAARSRGMATGSAPRVNATVVFAPGVQGASALGHVGHVVGVYGNGWFMLAEEFFSWNGGGYDRVSYRYAHVGPGVNFIY